MTKRIKWIDISKAIAIMLIALYHITMNEIFREVAVNIGLPLFMLISGYLYKKGKNKDYIIKKFKTIMIPFYFFAILEMIYYFCFEIKYRSNPDGYNIIKAIIGVLFGEYDYLFFNAHIWYLPYFFMVVIIYNFLANLKDEKIANVLFIILGIFSIFFTLPNIPFTLNRMDLLPYYAIGNICKRYDAFSFESYKKIWKLILAIVLLFVVSICYYYQIDKYGLKYILNFAGIIAVILFSQTIENNDKILYKIGNYTLDILCIHGPIYRAFIKAFSIIVHKDTEFIRSNVLYSIVVVIIVIALSYLISVVLHKIKDKLVEKKLKIA